MREIKKNRMKNPITETVLYKPKTPSRRIALAAMMISLALVLSIAESYIPVGALIPLPGIRVGLANIVTVFAIVSLKPSDTLIIIIARCLLMSLFTGPVSLLFSLTGAILAFVVMKLMVIGLGRTFSVIGISIGGAVMHNIGQITVAAILLKNLAIVNYYLPFLLIVSIFTGAIIGAGAIPVIHTMQKFNKAHGV
jgi:heptaprenyl diphosphate synthase